MTELSDALKINEAAMGSDRSEYQSMLRNSFDGMVERLSAFFNGEKVSGNVCRFSMLLINFEVFRVFLQNFQNANFQMLL